MSREMRFCCRSTCARSAGVRVPPFAARSVLISLLRCASRPSSRDVSRALSSPLLTPCAIRSCWRSARLLIGPAAWAEGTANRNAATAPAAASPRFRIPVSFMTHLLTPTDEARRGGVYGREGQKPASDILAMANMLTLFLVLRHLGPPVIPLEEPLPVSGAGALEQVNDLRRRAELPPQLALRAQEELPERGVAEPIVDRVEKQRPLVVQEPTADLRA